MANDFHATHVLLVLIGGFHLCSTAESGLPLAATSKSIYASITEAEYRQLNTTLMDVVNKYSNFKHAYQQTSRKRATVLARGKTFGMTDEESLAVMIYTTNAVYGEFNRILREGDTSKYVTSFQVFHFLLISAIEKIRVKQTLAEYLYRGVNIIFFAAQGTELRLPGYTSTSTNISVANSTIFRGNKGTLIRLKGVMFGADISGFSVLTKESEILIPPYESFKVTNVSTDGKGPLIYLESIGQKCGAVNHDLRRRRYTGGPCRCCRQPLNGDVPLQMGWVVLVVPLAVFVIVN
ncbi:GPI-linked NAD(P)(+)--arginine ADP-ribosyltransferase 1-like [Haliotis rufescens]|uniref:GPI-linked NAD(P)(+)--arginine ADP-ribosyltransferase 1-like n=1 Tax=Haliotis rufescens TaxID=6454 RepID=UPI00201F90C7|nr:GPI-linked NAD(P)(+)--arginine ADP-ribosyltransferase 1-like [Haliotis rufescens]